jgi:hypothetical protein
MFIVTYYSSFEYTSAPFCRAYQFLHQIPLPIIHGADIRRTVEFTGSYDGIIDSRPFTITTHES